MEFNISEHYYSTSVDKGFGTVDVSPDLADNEIKELVTKGRYEIPLNFIGDLKIREIPEKLPECIAFYQMTSGAQRTVFLDIHYTGRTNHTPDRFGNFFSHSLVLKRPDFHLPAALIFDQFKFKKSFPIEEDLHYSPQLQESDIDIDTSDGALKRLFDRFRAFLKDYPERLKVFSKTMDKIVDGWFAQKDCNITICDLKDALPEWVLALNYFLPGDVANKISFASYVADPEKYLFNITGVVPECSIRTLPMKYYVLINATQPCEHEIVHPYTIELRALLESGEYDDWKEFLEEAANISVTEPGPQLNKPAAYMSFLRNIHIYASANEFVSFLSARSADRQKTLKKLVITKNPRMYLTYLVGELQRAMAFSCTSVSAKFEEFKRLGLINFKELEIFPEALFNQFLTYFLSLFQDADKAQVCLLTLTELDEIQIPISGTGQLLDLADGIFAGDMTFDQKVVMAKNLALRYGFEYGQSNRSVVLSADQFINDVRPENLLELLVNNANLLARLNLQDKLDAFVLAWNKLFDKPFSAGFKDYIGYIQNEFHGCEVKFWGQFFERNPGYNPNSDYRKTDLNYLKKLFIGFIYLEQTHRRDIVEGLTITREEAFWISEYLSQHSPDSAVAAHFTGRYAEYFNRNY